MHAADALQTSDVVVIQSVDTDVVVLAAYHYNAIVKNGQDIIMCVGMAQHKRHISVRHLIKNLPAHVPSNILALHALTGSDSASSIFKVSKKRALNSLLLM